jgi:hypothetical protein
MQDYAFLKAFIEHGRKGAIALAVLAVLALLAAGLAGLASWPLVVAGIVAALVGGFLLLVLVDLTKVIQDMLMPR